MTSTSLNQQFPGTHIGFSDGKLCLGGVPLDELALKFGTPLFVYDLGRIGNRCDELLKALGEVSEESKAFYAVKALGNLSVLREIHQRGFGMDVVSSGEIERCLAAGVPASEIVFSGVAKSKVEIEFGVRVGIRSFNIESPHEVALLANEAVRQNRLINVALRINPDVDGDTHTKINTGLAETKFGLNLDLAALVAAQILTIPSLKLSGLTCHIGSQITSMSSVENAAQKVRGFANLLIQKGAPIDHIDMGGGLAVPYRAEEANGAPSFKNWVDACSLALPSANIALHLEPGRAIVADSGVLLCEVIDIKVSGGRRFALVDAGMTELIRPAMYGAYHHILSTTNHTADTSDLYDVAGPVCETSCLFGQNIALRGIKAGSRLAILSSGAYGMSMASNYNSRPKPAEVAIENGLARLIRKREALSSLWEDERFL